ncbi:WEB family protein [Senna tora]|uniref:WEB family protein n=1 Tax=Senna tora TaxID=362788 RepID=A0A834X983_9FABA|nr:WEB family protein [Senna tora]
MRSDRIWMYNRRHHSRKGLNDEFVAGVDQFIGYVLFEKNLGSNGQIRCPCLRCDNRKFIDVEIVKDHLYRHGFVPDYYQWIWHGEPFLHHDDIERVGIENDARVDVDNVERVVGVEVDEPNLYRTMILDAAVTNTASNAQFET